MLDESSFDLLIAAAIEEAKAYIGSDPLKAEQGFTIKVVDGTTGQSYSVEFLPKRYGLALH